LKKQIGNQTKLAKAAGVSQPTVQRWLAGTKVPDANALCRLADYFGITMDALWGRAPLAAGPSFAKVRGDRNANTDSNSKLDGIAEDNISAQARTIRSRRKDPVGSSVPEPPV